MTGTSGRPPWRARIGGWLGALWLRVLEASWRRRGEDLAALAAALAGASTGEGRVLVVFWHGKYVPLFGLLRGRRVVVFASRSARGGVIAEICRRCGYESLLLPDRGGSRSLRRMREALERTPVAGIAADGPLGPRHVVKGGVVRLASETGACVVPVSVAMDRKRVLAQRWDRMEIPRLWSRVAFVAGDPLQVPTELDDAAVRQWRTRVREALERCDRRAEELLAAARAPSGPPARARSRRARGAPARPGSERPRP